MRFEGTQVRAVTEPASEVQLRQPHTIDDGCHPIRCRWIPDERPDTNTIRGWWAGVATRLALCLGGGLGNEQAGLVEGGTGRVLVPYRPVGRNHEMDAPVR